MKTRETTSPPIAYKDEKFLDSEDLRPLRILAEYLQTVAQFSARKCARSNSLLLARPASHPRVRSASYYEAARELARLVTAWSKGLASHAHRYPVCSGGAGGIMEAARNRIPGASEAGGRTVGLNICLPHEQPASQPPVPSPTVYPSSSIISLCASFGSRISRGPWRCLSGGFGTLDEMAEILTLQQTGKLDRPILILLYGSSYWKEIINLRCSSSVTA